MQFGICSFHFPVDLHEVELCPGVKYPYLQVLEAVVPTVNLDGIL